MALTSARRWSPLGASRIRQTVVAAWLIAQRRVDTLVLVHRQHLLDQGRERLASFLDLPATQIGQVGAGKWRPTGQLDVRLIQSLARKGEVDDLVAQYGQVIVDECHHIPLSASSASCARRRPATLSASAPRPSVGTATTRSW